MFLRQQQIIDSSDLLINAEAHEELLSFGLLFFFFGLFPLPRGGLVLEAVCL